MEIHGYPVIQEEGFTITRGAMKPATYESYEAAKSAQEKLVGSTMTYKVSVPPAEVEEILERGSLGPILAILATQFHELADKAGLFGPQAV